MLQRRRAPQAITVDNGGEFALVMRARVERALSFVRASNPDDEVFVVGGIDNRSEPARHLRDVVSTWSLTIQSGVLSAE